LTAALPPVSAAAGLTADVLTSSFRGVLFAALPIWKKYIYIYMHANTKLFSNGISKFTDKSGVLAAL
jgi:hypothetical protein